MPVSSRPTTEAGLAIAESRARVGLGDDDLAAKRLGICPDYLRRCVLHGAPFGIAHRMAYLFQCPVDLLLNGALPATPKSARRRGRSRRRAPQS